jgi:hypothetical protein
MELLDKVMALSIKGLEAFQQLPQRPPRTAFTGITPSKTACS